MLTKTVDVQDTQLNFKELLSLIRQGAEVVLTEGSTPLARIVPLTGPTTSRVAGLHSGAIWTSDDFDDPL